MGAGKEASINLPCLLILASSWTASPSHSYSSELQAKGGHCAARTSCLLMGFVIGRNGSPGVAPPNVPVSGPSTSCLSNDLPRGGGREEGRVRRIGNSPGDFGLSWTELSEVGIQGGLRFITPLKIDTLTMGGGCGMLEGGRHGAWVRYKEPEGGREAISPTTYPNELIRIYKD